MDEKTIHQNQRQGQPDCSTAGPASVTGQQTLPLPMADVDSDPGPRGDPTDLTPGMGVTGHRCSGSTCGCSAEPTLSFARQGSKGNNINDLQASRPEARGAKKNPVQTIETVCAASGLWDGGGATVASPASPAQVKLRTRTYTRTELATHPWHSSPSAVLAARLLRIPTAPIVEASDYDARLRALGWVDGMRLPCVACRGTGQTVSADVGARPQVIECARCHGRGEGRDRGLAVASCGRPAIACTTDGDVGIVALRCRDRACPRCQRLRAIERAAELRDAMVSCPACEGARVIDGTSCTSCGGHGAVPWRWHFATLTVPKMHATERECSETIDVVMAAWSRMTRGSLSIGREFRARFHGGVRAVEVVYRERGEIVKYPGGRTHTVDMTGWHVHLHVVLDTVDGGCSVVPSVDRRRRACGCEPMRWLVEAWCDITGASPAAQLGRAVDRGDTGVAAELSKYVAKPLSMAMSRAVGRELFLALHGRRCLVGFGRWRRWRSLSERGGASLLIGPRLSTLADRVMGEYGSDPTARLMAPPDGRRWVRDEKTSAPWVTVEGYVHGGGRVTVELDAARVWRALDDGSRIPAVVTAVEHLGVDVPVWGRQPFAWTRGRVHVVVSPDDDGSDTGGGPARPT